MRDPRKYLPILKGIAELSKDRSTRVAALCLGSGGEILATGYNGFPRSVIETIDSRHERPEKYIWTCHAEENVVSNAARAGVQLNGSTMLLLGLRPCSTCARLIVQAGIHKLVVFPTAPSSEKWESDQVFSRAILSEGGVEVEVIE
jgi:dCMP deaminase